MRIAIISQLDYFRAFYEHDLDVLGEVQEFEFKFTMTEDDSVELEKFNADFRKAVKFGYPLAIHRRN